MASEYIHNTYFCASVLFLYFMFLLSIRIYYKICVYTYIYTLYIYTYIVQYIALSILILRVELSKFSHTHMYVPTIQARQ